MSRLSNFLDNRLTEGGEVVSLTPRPPFTLQEDSRAIVGLEGFNLILFLIMRLGNCGKEHKVNSGK
jgi:hypothetical protein